MRQPITIFRARQDLDCREILRRIRRRLSQWSEKFRGYQRRYVMLLESEQYGHFRGIQPRWQPMAVEQSKGVLQ